MCCGWLESVGEVRCVFLSTFKDVQCFKDIQCVRLQMVGCVMYVYCCQLLFDELHYQKLDTVVSEYFL